MRRLLVVAVWGLFVGLAAKACTVFLLTDGKQVLFCNNEDWINPNTRVWFVPAGPDYFGAVYVGFDNGLCQGGMNTEGLAFDAVAGYKEIWEPSADQKPVRGLSTQRMLETCATVDAAIAFYQAHREPA
jgi:penicillin V acylase-like amidase (Ntn superfamily)